MPATSKPFDLGEPQPEKVLVGIRRLEHETTDPELGRPRTNFVNQASDGVSAWTPMYHLEDATRPSAD